MGYSNKKAQHIRGLTTKVYCLLTFRDPLWIGGGWNSDLDVCFSFFDSELLCLGTLISDRSLRLVFTVGFSSCVDASEGPAHPLWNAYNVFGLGLFRLKA